MGLMDEQIQATLVLQEAEEIIQDRTKILNDTFKSLLGNTLAYVALKETLEGLLDLAIKYGRLQSIHEKLLSNESENP